MSTFRPGMEYTSGDKTRGEMSTAEKFYDLEESQKKYQELLE